MYQGIIILLALSIFVITACTTTRSGSAANDHADVSATPIVITDSSKVVAPLPNPPIAKLDAPAVTVQADSTNFVSARLYIQNVGGGVLTINTVQGSCGCATASVQRNNIAGSTKAMVLLNINTSKFVSGDNSVDYTISTNAGNSPTMFRVVVRK